MKMIGALILALTTASVLAQRPEVSMPAKSGWWVRVITQKTEASSVTLQIGTKKGDRRDWRAWRSDDPAEFDVPRDFLQVSELYVHGSSNPKGKTTRFCLFFQGIGVKQFDFDDDVETQVKQTDRDDSCK